MPNIAMCPGTNCPQKNDCLRFRAIQDSQQYYFSEAPYQEEYFMCDEFIPIEWDDKLTPRKEGNRYEK